jgi:hypothetical protein
LLVATGPAQGFQLGELLASGLSKHVFNDEHRCLVRVVVSNRNDAMRPSAQVDRVARRQFGTAAANVDGSAGVPSASSSLKVKPAIRFSCPIGWDRTALRFLGI